MFSIIDVVLPTFIVILIGYLVGKFTKFNMLTVTDITLYIGVPALAFTSLISKKIVLLDAAKICGSSFIISLGCLLVAWIVFKIIRQKHSGLYVPISIMNTVNIPFPIIYLAYGAEGLAAATLFYIPNIILIYTLGIFLMAGKNWKDNIREIVRQPVVYACIVGLICNFFNVKIPELALTTLDLIALMTIPLVLLILGYNLSRVNLTSLPTTFLASFLRMGVGLGIGFAVVYLLNISGVFRSVVILDSTMPAAAMTSILATKYKNETGLVSSVVLLTTLVSLVLIPFLLHILG